MKPAIGYEFLNGKFSFLAVWMSGLNRPWSSEPLGLRARSLVVSDLRSETKGSRFESGCQICAEVSSLQQSPG